ncbi:MAG: hypothetical protein MI922_15810 [Bacteroidales bacterium]|nr:hypothetical protein [Bacteroidales bacterium]
MLRRFLYILYMGLFAVTTITLLRATAPDGRILLVLAAFLILLGLILREVGYRYCEFSRLRESFPHGGPADWIPERIRREASGLLADFEAADGTRRQEIRQRLQELTDRQPLLLIVFERELERAIPGIHRVKAKPEVLPWLPPTMPPSKSDFPNKKTG